MSEKSEALAEAMRLVLADAFETYARIPPGLQRVAAIPCVVSRTELSQAARLLRSQHAEIERLKAENELLREALETMLTATTNDGKEQFPGHYSAFLEQVAKPRAKAALRREPGDG